jgi:hypothetical protein
VNGMKVKITGCSNSDFWYKDKIGSEYEVYPENKKRDEYLTNKWVHNFMQGYIDKRDCEIIEEHIEKRQTEYDNINKPFHYHKSGLDPITIMKRTFTKEEYAGFCKGNVLKYNQRYNEKGGVDDLKKALFYQDELIAWEGE